MSSFEFVGLQPPFHYWLGPYSPSRGSRWGFRCRYGQLGVWVEQAATIEFWTASDSAGAEALGELVCRHWGGGRVLLLPSGHVVKPLATEGEVGRRVLIGGYRGALRLRSPEGRVTELGGQRLATGAAWDGPRSVGLECITNQSGQLSCTWYHPTDFGREECSAVLYGPDRDLGIGFMRARPGVPGGRVRVTVEGHVITNLQTRDGDWETKYVGRVDRSRWAHDDEWISEEVAR